jgi:hypothetical protein
MISSYTKFVTASEKAKLQTVLAEEGFFLVLFGLANPVFYS